MNIRKRSIERHCYLAGQPRELSLESGLAQHLDLHQRRLEHYLAAFVLHLKDAVAGAPEERLVASFVAHVAPSSVSGCPLSLVAVDGVADAAASGVGPEFVT